MLGLLSLTPQVDQPQTNLPQTDVLIVGGGVCGTALLFELARYTDLASITLVERYDRLEIGRAHV